MVLRASCEGYATGSPNWGTGATSTRTAATLLTPGLLAANADFRASFFRASALASTRQVGRNNPVNQGFIKVFAQRGVGYTYETVGRTCHFQLHLVSPQALIAGL